LDFAGKPLYLETPASYRPKLSDSQKILFLLSEIERLDPSRNKQDASRALLHRADLARRLYGPIGDPDWNEAQFYYRFAERPSFQAERSNQEVKEFWKLDENEARTMVGQRLSVIQLTDSESPLALWQRLEEDYPDSAHVAEAVYQRGLYFQNRRQFSKAVGEYRRLLARFPKHKRVKIAKKQIEQIEQADVLLGKTGVYSPGSNPKLWFACRNANKVEFTVRRLDILRYILDKEKKGGWWEIGYSDWHHSSDEDHLKEYTGQVVKRWIQPVQKSDQVATHSTAMPISQIGGYVVEAHISGSQKVSRGVVVVTDAAIVKKWIHDKVLLWCVNARTGRPLQSQAVQINRYSRKQKSTTSETLTSDKNGVVEITPEEDGTTFALLVTDKGGIAFSEVQSSGFDGGYGDFDRVEHSYYAVTDRPLYRPDSTVQFRIWARELVDRKYRPAQSDVKLKVTIEGPDYGDTIKSFEFSTDEFGSVTGSFKLNREVPLGEYSLNVQHAQSRYPEDACRFRVEEYKKPEFEVAVTSAKKSTRLGETIKAKIEARYYFGTPVSLARVSYQVFRKSYRAQYAIPNKWDWLYGSGFGTHGSVNSRFTGSDLEFENSWNPYGSWPDEESPGELVSEGATRLDEDGSAEIAIDTSRTTRDRDYQYTIRVEVRDKSRRTIEGTATVLATRQQFHAFMELNRGWYQPGSQATVDINTRTANNIPVDIEGKLTFVRINSVGADLKDDVVQQVVRTWNVKTEVNGHAAFTFQVPGEGQYQLIFEVQDAWNQAISSVVNIWVYGPKFDGPQYRFGNLEIIPNRRWYEVGDTARLLINTSQPHARLLLYDSMGKHWFIDIPAHSRVLEIPITEKHAPNHFVGATLVHSGKVHTKTCQLYVPPVEDLLTAR